MEKTVKVSEENHTRLQQLGAKGESFNTIITRLIDTYELQLKLLKGEAPQ